MQLLYSQTAKLTFTSVFQSETITVNRKTRNHLPSNVFLYNTRKVIFTAVKTKMSRKSMNLSVKLIVQTLLHFNTQCFCSVTSGSVLNNGRYHLLQCNYIYIYI